MKKVIRLTESDLHRIIKESVKKTLKRNIRENDNSDDSIYKLAELLTGLDENTAESVATELYFGYRMGYDFDTIVEILVNKLDPTPYGEREDYKKSVLGLS